MSIWFFSSLQWAFQDCKIDLPHAIWYSDFQLVIINYTQQCWARCFCKVINKTSCSKTWHLPYPTSFDPVYLAQLCVSEAKQKPSLFLGFVSKCVFLIIRKRPKFHCGVLCFPHCDITHPHWDSSSSVARTHLFPNFLGPLYALIL